MPKTQNTPSFGLFEKLLIAIVGAMIGTGLTLLTTRYLEGVKISEREKFAAISQYMQAAWGDGNPGDYDYIRKLTLLSAYAPEHVVVAVNDYQKSGCSSQFTRACQLEWVTVLTELRAFAGADEIDPEILRQLTYSN